MELAAKWPIVSEAPTRKARIQSKYPGARDVLEVIESSTGPFKYGLKLSQLDVQYKFTTVDQAKRFFTTFLPFEARDDFDQVNISLQATLNATPHRSPSSAVDNFKKLARSYF